MYLDFFGNDPFWGAQDYYASVYRSVYWVIGLMIAAVVLGIILNFTFLRKSNEGRFRGFWGRVYDLLSMNRFHTEDITKLLGVITFLMITFLGLYMIFNGTIVWGILLIVFGNLLARVCYELIMMFAILTRKAVSMDRRLAGIQKFYSDDMEDWRETKDYSDAFGDEAEETEAAFDDEAAAAEAAAAEIAAAEAVISDPDASFEDKLKAAFGDLEDMPKYGYDEECKECDNWDEVSEDCYCEDDCLTCEKPDQDKVKAAAEQAAEQAEETEPADKTAGEDA